MWGISLPQYGACHLLSPISPLSLLQALHSPYRSTQQWHVSLDVTLTLFIPFCQTLLTLVDTLPLLLEVHYGYCDTVACCIAITEETDTHTDYIVALIPHLFSW